MRTTALLFFILLASVYTAAERHWQAGTTIWRLRPVSVHVFGPGASGFGPPNTTPTMRAMADVRTYVIETQELRLELQDVVRINQRSVDVIVGSAVTFALEKNTVYVRGTDGTEHRLRVTKKLPKPKS